MKACGMEKNIKLSNCSYEPGNRKGVCCEYVIYHRRAGEMPACFFPDSVEKAYDRSIARFVAIHGKR